MSGEIDFKKLADELNRETDRGTALVCGALLDSLLEKLFVAYLIENKVTDDLFDGDRPLAAFSAKISLAFSMGLISQLEFDDLTLIRKVRNDFAHDLGISFKTPSVKSRCEALKSYSEAFLNSQDINPGELGPRKFFTLASVGIALSLGHRAVEVNKHRVSFSWRTGPFGEFGHSQNHSN